MACGPTNVSGGRAASEAAADPFGFGGHSAFVQGMTTWAALWATPWRAAMVMAEEVVREHTNGRS